MSEEDDDRATSVTLDSGKIDVTGADLQIHIPLPAESEAYILIGRVVAEWSRLEHELDQIISDLLDVEPEKVGCVTARITGATLRLSAIIALATANKARQEIIAKLIEFQMKCKGPQKKRNRIVHDPWLLEATSGLVEQFRTWPNDGPRYGFETISTEELEKLIDQIQRRVQTAAELRRELHVAPSP